MYCGSSSGLHHLHGGPGWTIRLQRPWCGGYIAGWVCGPPGAVWTPVPPPVPGRHVQQWQQGWQPPVPHLQDHLRSEDRQPASRQGGVPCHPPLTARTPRLQNHPHHLQHPSWHPGTLTFHRCFKMISQMCQVWNKLCLVVVQGPEHPNPGKPFTARGFPRHCYLPDSDKGRKVNQNVSLLFRVTCVLDHDRSTWLMYCVLSLNFPLLRFRCCVSFWWHGTGGSSSLWAHQAPLVSQTLSSGMRCTTRRSLAPTWQAMATQIQDIWTMCWRSWRLRALLRRSAYRETELRNQEWPLTQ